MAKSIRQSYEQVRRELAEAHDKQWSRDIDAYRAGLGHFVVGTPYNGKMYYSDGRIVKHVGDNQTLAVDFIPNEGVSMLPGWTCSYCGDVNSLDDLECYGCASRRR